MYNEQGYVSWLHIELLSNTLFLKQIPQYFLKILTGIRFDHVEFYFIRKFENR